MFKPSAITVSMTKRAEYFGLTLTVPVNTHYLATDLSGRVFSYIEKPTKCADFWMGPPESTSTCVCYLEFEGDWTKSLVKL